MQPRVIRYSERPELWDSIADLSSEVWPEYNQHGDTVNPYWGDLYDCFPDWQFVLYDPGEQVVLGEGNTIPIAWDGTDAGLGPGIDVTIVAGFELRAAGGSPTPSVRSLPRSRRATGVSNCPRRCCGQCLAWHAMPG